MEDRGAHGQGSAQKGIKVVNQMGVLKFGGPEKYLKIISIDKSWKFVNYNPNSQNTMKVGKWKVGK